MSPSGIMYCSRRFARRRNSIGRRTSGSDVCLLREVGKCTPLLRPSHSGRPPVQVVQLCGLAGQDISREIRSLSFDVCQNPAGFLRLPELGNLTILGVIFVSWSVRLPLLCRQDLRFVSVEKVSSPIIGNVFGQVRGKEFLSHRPLRHARPLKCNGPLNPLPDFVREFSARATALLRARRSGGMPHVHEEEAHLAVFPDFVLESMEELSRPHVGHLLMEARKQFHCDRSLPLASEEALGGQVNPIRSPVGYFSLRSAAPLRMSIPVIDKLKRVLPVDHDRCWLGLLHHVSTSQAGTRSISVGTGSPPQSSGGSFAAKSVLVEDGSGMGASTCSFCTAFAPSRRFHSKRALEISWKEGLRRGLRD